MITQLMLFSAGKKLFKSPIKHTGFVNSSKYFLSYYLNYLVFKGCFSFSFSSFLLVLTASFKKKKDAKQKAPFPFSSSCIKDFNLYQRVDGLESENFYYLPPYVHKT